MDAVQPTLATPRCSKPRQRESASRPGRCYRARCSWSVRRGAKEVSVGAGAVSSNIRANVADRHCLESAAKCLRVDIRSEAAEP